MPLPLIPIVTTVGRIALPILSREIIKLGGKKFVKKYGKDALISASAAVTGGTIAKHYDDTTHKSVTDTPAGTWIGPDAGQIEKEKEKIKERLKPPETHIPENKGWIESFPDDSATLGPKVTEPAVSPPVETPKLPGFGEGFEKPTWKDFITYSKKDDVSKQTKKLVPEKVELGPLTKAEKQTALALKGDKPDYYSRIIKAIEESEQTKMSYDQWIAIAKKAGSKEELDYLGLEKLAALRQAKGKDIISKEDLLYDIRFYPSKDIASNIMVTTIPEEDMVSDFDEYSLGYEKTGSKKMNVYQIDLPPETSKDAEFNLGKKLFQASPAHVKEKYGRNQFLHTRTQVGLGDVDTPPIDFGEKAKEISEKLQNTLIIDEIQSDWIQSIQKHGTKDKPKAKVLKGSEITPEFIKENYGDFYDLRIEKYQTQKDLLENTGLSTNKVLYNIDIYPDEERVMRSVERRIEDDMYYVFGDKGLTQESKSVAFQEKESAMDHAKSFAVADFPIKHSKKWVEFALNNEIKNAVLGGQDSIAITNGNIQQSRSKEKGTKKFYDEIVRGQLEKIATKYGVKLEEISFEPDKYLRLQENLKKLKEKGFEETTVTREELVEYITKNTISEADVGYSNLQTVNLPDFREIIIGDDCSDIQS